MWFEDLNVISDAGSFFFGVCYALIMTERLHKTIVALFGAVS